MSINTSETLRIHQGTILGRCHRVENFLGEGGFGVVTKCNNLETKETVAIKVNKADRRTLHQARMEISMLKKLRSLDRDICNIVKWNGFFFHKENVCISFEHLDQSLRDYMSENNRPFHITQLRPILYQLASVLSHLGSVGIIHADIKPDNVMIVDRYQQPLKVKVIDFGLAIPTSEVEPGVCVQTLWYRAPEVMLEIPFNEAIDIWSLGVTAVELATGYPLYPGTIDYEVLSYILHTQGQPEDHILDRGMCTEYYFNRENDSQHHWRFKYPAEFKYETGLKPRDRRCIRVQCLDELEQVMKMTADHHEDQHSLMDLIKDMLHLDADRRIKPQEVLQHSFFRPSLPQTSSTDISAEMTDDENDNLGPRNIRRRAQSSPSSLNAPLEEENEEVNVQPGTNTENIGFFWRAIRRMTDFFHRKFF